MISAADLVIFRTALLITLSILLVAVLWRKFRRSVLANDMPAVSHVELIALEVAYHPARLRVHLVIPHEHAIDMELLDDEHRTIQRWPPISIEEGKHMVEQTLPELADGSYFLQLNTDTQRTVRQFRLQRT